MPSRHSTWLVFCVVAVSFCNCKLKYKGFVVGKHLLVQERMCILNISKKIRLVLDHGTVGDDILPGFCGMSAGSCSQATGPRGLAAVSHSLAAGSYSLACQLWLGAWQWCWGIFANECLLGVTSFPVVRLITLQLISRSTSRILTLVPQLSHQHAWKLSMIPFLVLVHEF